MLQPRVSAWWEQCSVENVHLDDVMIISGPTNRPRPDFSFQEQEIMDFTSLPVVWRLGRCNPVGAAHAGTNRNSSLSVGHAPLTTAEPTVAAFEVEKLIYSIE